MLRGWVKEASLVLDGPGGTGIECWIYKNGAQNSAEWETEIWKSSGYKTVKTV